MYSDLSSILDQAELSSSIRLEMARKNKQEGHEFSLRITDFSRNEARLTDGPTDGLMDGQTLL